MTRLVITVEGGVVQAVSTDTEPAPEVVLIDFDVDDADEDGIVSWLSRWGTERAAVAVLPVDRDEEVVERVFALAVS